MIGKFDLLLPGRQIRELVLMAEIERDPGVSQSALAGKVGLVPSMVNAYIRRMTDQGLVEKHGDNSRSISYHLTPAGRSRRSELMRRYSIETVRLYKYAKSEFRRLLSGRADGLRNGRTVIYGAAETGELICQVLMEMGCRLAGVVDSDPRLQGRDLFGHRVAAPASLERLSPDVVIVASLGHADEIERTLAPLSAAGVAVITLELGSTV